jgi:hypothetical protein
VETFLGERLTCRFACSQTPDDSSGQVHPNPTDHSQLLLSHTPFYVRPGTGGAAAARVAIGRAQRQLAVEGGVHLHVRNFAVRLPVEPTRAVLSADSRILCPQVINQVGASSLRATLNCDAFAREHSAESHFDKQSFVGLAWRPPREDICCGKTHIEHNLLYLL